MEEQPATGRLEDLTKLGGPLLTQTKLQSRLVVSLTLQVACRWRSGVAFIGLQIFA